MFAKDEKLISRAIFLLLSPGFLRLVNSSSNLIKRDTSLEYEMVRSSSVSWVWEMSNYYFTFF